MISTKEVIVQCLKYNLRPWVCRTFFNPEAEFESINIHHEPYEVLQLSLKALLSSRDYEFKAFELFSEFKNVIFEIMKPSELYLLSKSMIERFLDLKVDAFQSTRKYFFKNCYLILAYSKLCNLVEKF